jgi:hypothetical protein
MRGISHNNYHIPVWQEISGLAVSFQLYRESPNPPKSPFSKGGLLKPPFEKGGQGGFLILGGEAFVIHERLP